LDEGNKHPGSVREVACTTNGVSAEAAVEVRRKPPYGGVWGKCEFSKSTKTVSRGVVILPYLKHFFFVQYILPAQCRASVGDSE
jgi:hypothetical protein